jgi:thiol-disulfide isomerase/thioredoxin
VTLVALIIICATLPLGSGKTLAPPGGFPGHEDLSLMAPPLNYAQSRPSGLQGAANTLPAQRQAALATSGGGPAADQQFTDDADTTGVASPESDEAPVTHVDLVRASQVGNLDQRIQLLEGYLNRPIRPELRRLVFRMLVSTCSQAGDYEGALFYGDEALSAYPTDAPILLELTSVCAEMDDPDLDKGIDYAKRAMDALDEATEAMGEGGEGRISIFVGSCLSDWGWLLYRKGETAEAERKLAEAADRRKDTKVYDRLARVQTKGGKLNDARDSYAMAIALSSGKDSTAVEGLNQVVAMQGGDETDVETVLREKREEIAALKKEMLRQQTKIEPRAAPPLDVTTLAGQEVSLDDLKGKVVVVDFWATWCGPCRKELPVVQKVSEQFKDDGVFFLAASVDADTSKVRPYVKANSVTLPVAFARLAGGAYGASSIPSLFLIDGNGMIRYLHTGYHPDLEEVLSMQIRELVNEL